MGETSAGWDHRTGSSISLRRVLFEDRDYVYELSYSAAESDYARYDEVFEQLLSTFRFLN